MLSLTDITVITGAFFIGCLAILRASSSPKVNIPRIGKPGVLGFVQSAIRFTIDADGIIAEGREKFLGRPYLLPTFAGAMVVLGPDYLEMLRSSNDKTFNQPRAVDESLQLKYTMNDQQLQNPYQATVVRTDLQRALASLVPEIVEETELSTGEALKTYKDSSSVRVPVFNTMTRLIARISNRVMLGTELCRDEGFLHAIVQFAETAPMYAPFIMWAPVALRSTVYFILSSIFGGKKGALEYIVPFLKRYLRQRDSMIEKPNLFVEFMVRQAPPHETVEGLAMRIMNMNFGSIHTSSIFITQALFELAILSQSRLDEIRDEAAEALKEEGGFSKSAVAKFFKLDSVLREVGRVHGLMHFALPRITMTECVLLDGTAIPAGYSVAIDMKALHFDPEFYPDPHVFDPFRFSKIRGDGDNDIKYDLTTVDGHFLPFGAGRHACAGRFFASLELKIMLAHILLNYDFSFPAGTTDRPKNILFNGAVIPDPKAKLNFRRRQHTL